MLFLEFTNVFRNTQGSVKNIDISEIGERSEDYTVKWIKQVPNKAGFTVPLQ